MVGVAFFVALLSCDFVSLNQMGGLWFGIMSVCALGKLQLQAEGHGGEFKRHI